MMMMPASYDLACLEKGPFPGKRAPGALPRGGPGLDLQLLTVLRPSTPRAPGVAAIALARAGTTVVLARGELPQPPAVWPIATSEVTR
jgi:hypothetical protein